MRKLFLVIILFFVAISVFAQANVGSPYSRFGIGDINLNPSVRSQSMGNLGYTLVQQNNISYANPSSIADVDTLLFIFDVGLIGGYRTYSIQEPELKQTRSDFQIAYMNFAFSINKYWKMAFGVNPYSSVKYDIALQDNEYEKKKTYRFEGSGGINKIFLTNAFSVMKNLKVGITASYLFGEILQNNSTEFNEDRDEGFFNLTQQNKNRISDFTFDLGAKYSLNIDNKNTAIIGLFYGHNKDLRSFQSSLTRSVPTNINYIDTLLNTDEVKGKISLPQTLGIGLGYCFDEKLYSGIDFTVQNWSNAEFFGIKDNMNNGTFLSFGAEYRPAGMTGNTYKYWQAVSYRIGAYYNTTYIKILNEQKPLNDFGMTFGINLPMKRSKTSFDIFAKIGQRGNYDDGLIKENYTIVGIAFNLADRWFIKSKFD